MESLKIHLYYSVIVFQQFDLYFGDLHFRFQKTPAMRQQMLFFEDDLGGQCIRKYFINQFAEIFVLNNWVSNIYDYIDNKFLLFCNVPYSIAEFVVGCNDASGYFSSGNTATLKYFKYRFTMLSNEF